MQAFPSQPAIIAATSGTSARAYERRAAYEAVVNSLRFQLHILVNASGRKALPYDALMQTIAAARVAAHRALGV